MDPDGNRIHLRIDRGIDSHAINPPGMVRQTECQETISKISPPGNFLSLHSITTFQVLQ